MKKLKWLDETCNSCNKQINSWDKRILQISLLRGMYRQRI